MKNRTKLAAAILVLSACESSSSTSNPGTTGDGGTFPASDGGGTGDGGGNGDAGGDDGGGGTGACSITLSGAVSKTVPCTFAAEYDTSNGQSGVPIESTTSLVMGAPEVTFAMRVNGELTAKTYAWADALDEGATLVESVSDAWAMSEKDAEGSSSITLTSVTTTGSSASGKVYAIHGTVTATLVAKGSATGSVMMTMTF